MYAVAAAEAAEPKEMEMAEYDVTGEWVAHQSNGFDVTFRIRPTNGDFTELDVEASYSGGFAQGKGEVSGDSFWAEVDWEAGPVGRYEGSFGSDGRLSGTTFDRTNPSSSADWSCDNQFRRDDGSVGNRPAGASLFD
jgi:hypothetical protein